jgi:hypothetical protein
VTIVTILSLDAIVKTGRIHAIPSMLEPLDAMRASSPVAYSV